MEPVDKQASPEKANGNQVRWEAAFTSLTRFLAESGRLPALRAEDPDERRLASWLRYQRMHASPARAEALDSAIPDWRRTVPDLKWEAHLESVAAFTATHGRHPSAGSSDRQEQLLGYWLVKQRQVASPERAARLDSRIPAWRGFRDQAWSENLAKVASFVEVHGHVPHQTGATSEERSLASWLKDQRRHASGERAAALDENVPNWRGNHPGHRSWEDSFASVREFHATTGRLPSYGDAGERRMASWLSDQSRRATEKQRTALDRALPGWEPVVVSWAERHAAVLEFFTANGRLPEQKDSGTGNVLGKWLESQRYNASPEARSILDATLPGWHVSLEDKWEARLEELRGHLVKHGRLPRQRAKGPETALARWVDKQRRFATPDRASRLDAAAPGWRGKKSAA